VVLPSTLGTTVPSSLLSPPHPVPALDHLTPCPPLCPPLPFIAAGSALGPTGGWGGGEAGAAEHAATPSFGLPRVSPPFFLQLHRRSFPTDPGQHQHQHQHHRANRIPTPSLPRARPARSLPTIALCPHLHGWPWGRGIGTVPSSSLVALGVAVRSLSYLSCTGGVAVFVVVCASLSLSLSSSWPRPPPHSSDLTRGCLRVRRPPPAIPKDQGTR
jgi:hypothetical protein